MERRMLMAIVLSFLAVTLYSSITGRGCMAPPKKKPPVEDDPSGSEPGAPDGQGGKIAPKKGGDRTPEKGASKGSRKGAGKGAAKGDGDPAGENGDEPAPSPESDLDSHPQRKVPPTRVTLESEELKVVVTSQAGSVESVQHKHAFESDGKTPFDQIVPPSPILQFLSIDDRGVPPAAEIDAPGGADRRTMEPGPMRLPELQWTLDPEAASATEEVDAFYRFTTPAGLVYTKRFVLAQGEKRYDLHLELSVKATTGDAPEAVHVKLLAASGQLREHVLGAFAMPSGAAYRLSSVADISDTLPYGIGLNELTTGGRGRERLVVFGTRSPFFLTLYYEAVDVNQPETTYFWATGEDAVGGRVPLETNIETFYREQRGIELDEHAGLDRRVREGVEQLNHCWMALRLPTAADAQPTQFSFYVGPNERSTLAQDPYKTLKSVMTYPNAPDFVADILLFIYDLWRGLFGSAGLAVILMTLCVRGGLMPLSVKNQLSMRRYGRKVAKLKPKVAELQKRYASNPKKLREEQMKLYREHGVGFPAGCLMMLVQIPIFFSLFSSLRVEYSVRGAGFLWIDDLSGPDRLIDFGSRIVDFGPMFYVESLNILPLLMVVLSILHTRNMPKPADEQQAQQMKMMKWLPIMFAVILYNYTAALALYMVLSSAVAIVESKIVRAKDEHDQEPDAAPATA